MLLLAVLAIFASAFHQFPLSNFGSSTVTFCPSSNDILTVHNFKISPDPPKRGQPLTVTMNGTLKRRVNDGIAHVKAKLGFIQLIDRDYLICDYAKEVDMKCPFEKGPLIFEKVINVPAEVPPGRYRVHIDVYLEDLTPMTCLDAEFRLTL